jgi:hypothetical protein
VPLEPFLEDLKIRDLSIPSGLSYKLSSGVKKNKSKPAKGEWDHLKLYKYTFLIIHIMNCHRKINEHNVKIIVNWCNFNRQTLSYYHPPELM